MVLIDLYSNASSEKIIRKTNELTLEQLEDPDFYEQTGTRPPANEWSLINLMSDALSQVQGVIGIIALASSADFILNG
jgi:ATP-binding cassette subfamily B protein